MIEFINVSKAYREPFNQVFKDYSFRVEPGEFILLTGKSGIGKTTIIKLLLKELEPDEGRILVQEQDIGKLTPKSIPLYRRKLGVVFQDFRLIPGKTVYENIDIARLCTGGRKKDSLVRVTSILKMLRLDRKFKNLPGELSGGEKQKVCLARALVNSPSILLADEPTGNLDPAQSREIMELFELIHQRGTTVFVATHDTEAAQGLNFREIRIE